MKHAILLLLTSVLLISCGKETSFNRTKVNFGSEWTFTKDSTSLNWEKINLPHTTQIEPLVVNGQWQGDCWYQKKFDQPKTDNKVFLYFEGVMHEAWVWVNGELLTHHQGGYLPFTVDITDIVLPHDNTIIVKVNNQDNPQIPPGKTLKTLDFNYYGGIYRNVYLIQTNKTYITDAVHANQVNSGGILVNFNTIIKEKASGLVKIHVKNEDTKSKKVKVSITFKNGSETISFTTNEVTMEPNSNASLSQSVEILNPKLWGIENPNLYEVEVNLIADSKTIDSQTIQTGIRKAELKADGFYLNDEKVFINGTNRHQEYPYIGYALSDEANYRDAVKIKNAGFDFVRLSHYPQTESFMKACDELGLLVMNCISGWQFSGDEKFIENSYQEIRDLARRDRNHPSVVFWEVSLNESDMKEPFMKKANEILRAELPYANIYTAGWIDNPNYDLYIPARQHGKAPEYWNNYEKGKRKIFIAEYGDWEYYAQNAGFNQTSYANLKEEERTSRQLRAFGEKRLLQQAFNYQEAFNSNLKGKNTIGQANWLMFDYNRGYADDIESSGISDIFRIPKFAFYFYQSQRSPNLKLNEKLVSGPMVHIASYWNEKSPLNVTVFSNCDEVALYLNDKLITKQKPTVSAFSNELPHSPFVFSIPKFEKGTLRAEGYSNGKKVAEHSVKSANEASKISLSHDESTVKINPDFPDVIFVYAAITDENGTTISEATNWVEFSLEGENAELIGQNPMQAEAGIATILLKTKNFKKPITIKAKSSGLKETSIEIK
ncbi:MAG: glycoside hydrolase family 2 TIM barrel-domain containing protein [Flavobacterium sp.]|nr:glycoside hydrolase family 2 TIM barrel-domain containing protein [Flavobacterium sp.]